MRTGWTRRVPGVWAKLHVCPARGGPTGGSAKPAPANQAPALRGSARKANAMVGAAAVRASPVPSSIAAAPSRENEVQHEGNEGNEGTRRRDMLRFPGQIGSLGER